MTLNFEILVPPVIYVCDKKGIKIFSIFVGVNSGHSKHFILIVHLVTTLFTKSNQPNQLLMFKICFKCILSGVDPATGRSPTISDELTKYVWSTLVTGGSAKLDKVHHGCGYSQRKYIDCSIYRLIAVRTIAFFPPINSVQRGQSRKGRLVTI